MYVPGRRDKPQNKPLDAHYPLTLKRKYFCMLMLSFSRHTSCCVCRFHRHDIVNRSLWAKIRYHHPLHTQRAEAYLAEHYVQPLLFAIRVASRCLFCCLFADSLTTQGGLLLVSMCVPNFPPPPFCRQRAAWKSSDWLASDMEPLVEGIPQGEGRSGVRAVGGHRCLLSLWVWAQNSIAIGNEFCSPTAQMLNATERRMS